MDKSDYIKIKNVYMIKKHKVKKINDKLKKHTG